MKSIKSKRHHRANRKIRTGIYSIAGTSVCIAVWLIIVASLKGTTNEIPGMIGLTVLFILLCPLCAGIHEIMTGIKLKDTFYPYDN